VATDQKSSFTDTERAVPGSVIENELATYRAISTRAVFSLIFGALATFSFAHPAFYLAAVLAVVLGVFANRAIRRHPDMLTGTRLANAGIALGLVSGLVTGTYTTVQTYVRTRQAEQFGKHYAQILSQPQLADIITYNLHPEARKNNGPEELLKQLDSPSPKEKMMVDQKYGQLLALRKRLRSSQDQRIKLVNIEGVGEDEGRGGEIPIYAFALYEVNGPSTKEFPEEQQFALAILKARHKGKQYEWWVDDVRFPYIPKSYVAASKPVDDGHGHAH
jgi:hypothetical protein